MGRRAVAKYNNTSNLGEPRPFTHMSPRVALQDVGKVSKENDFEDSSGALEENR